MLPALIKISSKWHSWNQAVMDELVYDYLQILADDAQCEVSELANEYGIKNLHHMIVVFKNEIELIWEEELQT